MWENIFDGMPAYGKPMLEAMGVDTAEKWASAFGAVNGSPDRERPYMIAADIAAVALARYPIVALEKQPLNMVGNLV